MVMEVGGDEADTWWVRDETMGGGAERGRRQGGRPAGAGAGGARPPARAELGRRKRWGAAGPLVQAGPEPGASRRRGVSATPAWGEVGWDLGEMGSWGE